MFRSKYWYEIGFVLLSLIILLALTPASDVLAQNDTATPDVIVYLFWGEGCPHCAVAKPYLESLQVALSRVEVRDYEIYYSETNQELFINMAASMEFTPRGVPTIIIGDYYWEGFSEGIQQQIETVIRYCLENGCRDAGLGIVPESIPIKTTPDASEPTENAEATPINSPTPLPQASTATTPNAGNPIDLNDATSEIMTLPIIGEINLATQSMAVSTLIIAFVDGFNPCSLWVLSVLLALTLHTRSRRKVLIIGLVFIAVTALVYVLFIAGLFSLFTYISFLGWIQVLIALLALFFAAVNIKDYFWYKEGVSFTIADEKKTGIFQGIRKIMDNSQSLWGLVGATIVMAAGVSLVEFSCTAGFPVLWANLLAAQNVGTVEFIFLLFIYMVIYQIDELVIFLAAVFTLKTSRLEEKQGRILKLVGGMLMLTLALVMLIDPGLMNSVVNSLYIFAIAFASAMLVLLFHRKVLPAFGIWVGSENKPRKKHKARH